ncbi:glycoside hydrolase family 16 protein [Nocardioides xinjiangensis]|uniref:glycoside hydrolase family 16 protein n=1 Tax=Nocardioides xinjiangensis TaxID=2817376 RepID=UPI001B30A6B9|nr:family 16 glycosylhydrolase [Nocardioides sp. SYSU D00778]
MSRTPRLAPRSASRRRLSSGLVAVVFVTAGCSSSGGDEPAASPSYERSDAVRARVLPQLAATGPEVEAADDAAWVVDVTVADAQDGTAVALVARTDDGWAEVDEEETDDEGRVALTGRSSGELHVVVGDGADAIGTEVSTDDAPEATFTDDFDSDTVDAEGGSWFTRDQGYIGVRTCSRADASAAEVGDGVLRLSVLEDEDASGQCRLPGRRKQFPYRLNGHVGTEGVYGFTYGFAAARIKTQAARGQHSAFWLQATGGQSAGGPEEGGAEIDVMEYFGDDHPLGGLTSFTYYLDEDGEKQTDGGWVEDLEEYGEDWAEEFHVFSVEWTPEEYVFRIDGQVTHRLEGPTSGREEFLILSLLSSDYELPRFNGELPETMKVDWARVWETGPE